MPHCRTAEELSRVRQELLDLLDDLIARNASDEEKAALSDTIDDLTADIWKRTKGAANDA